MFAPHHVLILNIFLAVLNCKLPETKSSILPQTLDEAAHIPEFQMTEFNPNPEGQISPERYEKKPNQF